MIDEYSYFRVRRGDRLCRFCGRRLVSDWPYRIAMAVLFLAITALGYLILLAESP